MKNTEFCEEKNKIEKSTLYIVGTPIGNMADISNRALKTLENVDFVAAEDTRNSGKLLSGYEIKQNYVTYQEHNKREAGEKIIERLKNGESCALVTDAGMPGISDPGADMVKLCADNGIKITSVPGPAAFVTALVLSGMNTERFAFEGFLKGTDSQKKAQLEKIKSDDRTLIFYEAPHRLKVTLELLICVFGDRKIALCRELTKMNEEIERTTIEKAIETYKIKEPRGEYVLVVEGQKEVQNDWSSLTVEQHIQMYMENENLSKMEAMKKTAKDRGLSKSQIYKMTLK